MDQYLDHAFSRVTIRDIPLLKRYLKVAQYEEANLNLINIITWLDAYPLWKLEKDNHLVLLGIHERQCFIYMPLCHKQDVNDALKHAKSVLDRHDIPFVCYCFTEEMADMVLSLFPNLHKEPLRNAADYVYRNAQLRQFSGKKLQKKRNHLNAFYKQYEGRWAYTSYHTDDFDDVLDFLYRWHQADDTPMLAYEKLGILRVLEHWPLLDARGGIIRIDGQVQALTIGSTLSTQMCQINAEKADESIRGLYQAICKEFLSHEYPDLLYVNREDDMGIFDLRKAKEAYHPEYQIMKYRLH